jgi:hypothetical protein
LAPWLLLLQYRLSPGESANLMPAHLPAARLELVLLGSALRAPIVCAFSVERLSGTLRQPSNPLVLPSVAADAYRLFYPAAKTWLAEREAPYTLVVMLHGASTPGVVSLPDSPSRTRESSTTRSRRASWPQATS